MRNLIMLLLVSCIFGCVGGETESFESEPSSTGLNTIELERYTTSQFNKCVDYCVEDDQYSSESSTDLPKCVKNCKTFREGIESRYHADKTILYIDRNVGENSICYTVRTIDFSLIDPTRVIYLCK